MLEIGRIAGEELAAILIMLLFVCLLNFDEERLYYTYSVLLND